MRKNYALSGNLTWPDRALGLDCDSGGGIGFEISELHLEHTDLKKKKTASSFYCLESQFHLNSEAQKKKQFW